MRTTTSISFFCRNSKTNKQGLAPIECGICINGERRFINLPRKERPADFNRKRKSQDLEDYISLMRTRINQICTEMLANNEPITSDGIREYIRYGGYKHYTINDMFNDYLKILAKRVDVDMTMGVYEKYKQVSTFILKRIDGNLEVTALTPAFIQNVIADTYATYKVSTAIGYITKFKTFVKYAMDNNKLKVNPFQNVKLRREKTNIVFLNEYEMSLIAGKEYGCERLRKVADCFIFQCCTGLSYSDLALLQPEDMKEVSGGYYIQKPRKKTGTVFTSVVLPEGVEIWKKYGGKLPIMSCQHLNGYLKEIETICGITKKLHTHLARKSYACRLLRSGVRLEVVSKTLGHSSTKITQAAYADLLNVDIVKEVKAKI